MCETSNTEAVVTDVKNVSRMAEAGRCVRLVSCGLLPCSLGSCIKDG